MRIIISPAKKMISDSDSFACHALPLFLRKTEQLLTRLRELSYPELKALWRCSDSIALLNMERLADMDLQRNLTPALMAYEGIQYRYMAPGVFTDRALDYTEERLRILSGFYGLLRPFDGVTPYRLEMQAKLAVGGCKDLYDFWGREIADLLFSETDTVLDLASKEYSRCVSPYVPQGVRLISCVFGELKDRRVIEKGTQCKMARGEMVRYLAEQQVDDLEQLKEFSGLGYRFSPERSDQRTYIFLKDTSE